MLGNTFKLIKGVGTITEKRLWEQGITTWEDLLSKDHVKNVSTSLLHNLRSEVEKAVLELKKNNAGYFASRLKPADLWRTYEAFENEAIFLDTETTGLSPHFSELTMVGLYDGFDYRCLIRGRGLSEERLQGELKGYRVLVTYNGRGFDVPYLQGKFPALMFPAVHLDLLPLGRRVGLRGGLKVVESTLGLERPEDIKDMTGYDAVVLWSMYERGFDDALRILREYNQADVINLKTVAREIYRRLKQATEIERYERQMERRKVNGL